MDRLDHLAAARQDAPLDRGLAAREHEAFAQSVLDKGSQYGPLGQLLAAAVLLSAVPGYQGAKYAAQNLPGGDMLNSAGSALGVPLAGPQTTAPGWDQLLAGLRPLLNSFAGTPATK